MIFQVSLTTARDLDAVEWQDLLLPGYGGPPCLRRNPQVLPSWCRYDPLFPLRTNPVAADLERRRPHLTFRKSRGTRISPSRYELLWSEIPSEFLKWKKQKFALPNSCWCLNECSFEWSKHQLSCPADWDETRGWNRIYFSSFFLDLNDVFVVVVVTSAPKTFHHIRCTFSQRERIKKLDKFGKLFYYGCGAHMIEVGSSQEWVCRTDVGN